MNVLTTTDVPLDTLAAEIKARIEAGDRAADSHQATKRIGGSLRVGTHKMISFRAEFVIHGLRQEATS